MVRVSDLGLLWATSPPRQPLPVRRMVPRLVGHQLQQQQSPLRMLQPLTVRGLTLRNRVVRMGAHEGLCERNGITGDLITEHSRILAGGAAMTTVAYGAVHRDGRTFDDQLVVGQDSLPGLKDMTAACHNAGGAVSIQLTHAGWFSNPRTIHKRPNAPSTKYSPAIFGWCRGMNQRDIDSTVRDFATAASLCKGAGFDAVEVHAGHGYLLSQFLSPRTNRRWDKYGGSIENRTRIVLEVLEATRKAVGDNFPIFVKLNMCDGMWRGLSEQDSLRAAQLIERSGLADCLVCYDVKSDRR
eukprot:TRINITY_DN1596_c1_g1_i1.p1 TRINITY_DN1596_c1_g1~~TRINITY_DN1596_c1_g1_i1.p1  ORF type:complete len:298 (-),score=56.58 TRINITY_DN1596_c1_g1_i1:609-1502(-)